MKKIITIIICAAVLATGVLFGSKYVLAEQSGSSPESGATSYIKATYYSIVALGHGSVAAGAWGDWGSYWNRIRSAAEWVPDGTAGTGDVLSTKTFYGNTRSSQNGAYVATNLIPGNVKSGTTYGVDQTGTLGSTGPCPTQAYHDNHTSATQGNNCNVSWTTNTSVTGAEKLDPVTGLIWSNLLYNSAGTVTFSLSLNTAWSWDASDADNVAVGGKIALQLCSERGDSWRLPTQKELMQAYIDGSNWNLTQPSYNFWSATESSALNAWYVNLTNGTTYPANKTVAYWLRCVR